jgi:hypothetical protein
VLPKNNLFLGYPNPSSLPSSYVKLPGKVCGGRGGLHDHGRFEEHPLSPKASYDLLASAHSVYDRVGMLKLVPNGFFVTVLRDPVAHFVSSWHYWHTSEHIFRASGLRVDMETFLADPVSDVNTQHCASLMYFTFTPPSPFKTKYTQYLSPGDIRLLHNSMTYDLGLARPNHQTLDYLIRELNYMVGDSRGDSHSAGSIAKSSHPKPKVSHGDHHRVLR